MIYHVVTESQAGGRRVLRFEGKTNMDARRACRNYLKKRGSDSKILRVDSSEYEAWNAAYSA